jgi:N-methylhydantoinase A/oxoprolinase/acetone carboxylase beta subunit
MSRSRPRPRLGVDVGGTNTDAVLMLGDEVIASAKRLTTADVGEGVIDAVTAVLKQASVQAGDLTTVMIGTTQFINAFVQRRDLTPVAAIRIALPKADGIPPLFGWPGDVLNAVGRHPYLIGGGAFFNGKEYAPLDEAALQAAGRDINTKGIEAIAITSCFSAVRPDIEQRAAQILEQIVPDADITLSSEVGGPGLLDRENAAVINACLRPLSRRVVESLRQAFSKVNVRAPIYLSQNDGTLISTKQATRFPILTCSAGPTNSLRGAAFLTGMQDAIVIDIGGTTSDFGVLVKGFPRETATTHLTGGVRTNFRMPDVLSIALGGGTRVRVGNDGKVNLGPDSVGFRLGQQAKIFGGPDLTTTDIAVRAGQLSLGDPKQVADISPTAVTATLDEIHARLEASIDLMKTNSKPVPVILVGGGHVLVSRPLRGVSEVLRPKYAEVANAVGAAIALVSGRVDKLYDFAALGREAALKQAAAEARAAAVSAGALEQSVEIVDVVELPMTHIQSGAVRVKVRAVGSLAVEA